MVDHSVNLKAKEHLTRALDRLDLRAYAQYCGGIEMLRRTEAAPRARASEDRTVIRSFPDTSRSVYKGFIEGTIMSHEIENPSNDLYMLLSLHAQASLGFVKDVQLVPCT